MKDPTGPLHNLLPPNHTCQTLEREATTLFYRILGKSILKELSFVNRCPVIFIQGNGPLHCKLFPTAVHFDFIAYYMYFYLSLY